MSTDLNRVLMVRTADRLRAELARDEATGLPIVDALSEADRRELCQVGGGRVAAVAIRVEALIAAADTEPQSLQDHGDRALVVREIARLVREHVRQTDLIGWLNAETLLVLAPGLDAVGSRGLAARLQSLFANRHVEIAGMQLELRIRVGSAFCAPASPSTWTTTALGAEAQLQANETGPAANVA